MAKTVLVVEDSAATRDVVARALSDPAWRIEFEPDLRSAQSRVAERAYDVIITGLATSSAEDVAALRRMRRTRPGLKMIVLTAEQEPEAVLTALREHAFSYFSMPVSADELRPMVERAAAEPAWDDGLEVLSAAPHWIAVRARCRMVTADRLVRFIDALSIDLPDDDRQATATAFREILLNAIEHGGKLDPETTVEITRLRAAGAVIYLVRDPGEGFDPLALPHAAVSNPEDPTTHVAYRAERGMRAGGFGLLVAQGMVDELLHNAVGNQAALIKYVK